MALFPLPVPGPLYTILGFVAGFCMAFATGAMSLVVVFVTTFLSGLFTAAASVSALSSGTTLSGTSGAGGGTCGGATFSSAGDRSPFISGCSSPNPSLLFPKLISIRSCTTAGVGGCTFQLIKINMSNSRAQILTVYISAFLFLSVSKDVEICMV